MSSASKRANRRASGPVLTSRFLFVPDHSAPVLSKDDAATSTSRVKNSVEEAAGENGENDDSPVTRMVNGELTAGKTCPLCGKTFHSAKYLKVRVEKFSEDNLYIFHRLSCLLGYEVFNYQLTILLLGVQ